MKKMMLGAAIGLTMLAASAAASAHVDVAVGLGVPGVIVAPVQPVYAAPAPVVVGYGDDWRADEDWRARRAWREREWREREWRRHEAWREHEWRERDRARWGY
ncbi:hypothetical protein J8I87_08760 [Paraburkholderia sp. LEh10]|jgi:hypothetical protein|uniref:hypothetical protein n=1 Tax=Paraburkholderia sp. LEh10 TaxID=2821353 RepID=UPI001AE7A522|nr:hypothetical protein [Paraburkholderia sp. LEh10]MBP0589805.1 hypothetical protein [Paraburkholderia sp. LEh10]